jgi:two-component system, OmpR family, response regulator
VEKKPKRTLRILIADDDRDTAMSLAAILQHEGHEVSSVYRGDAVLEQVRNYKPDAVLLDIGMPGLTGFEIARELRRQLGAGCPLLVAVTAWNQKSAKVLGKLVGFSHYITKPYSTGDLLGVLAQV